MNILANYATSYVGAFDLALSARRRDQGEATETLVASKGQSLIARLLFPGRFATTRAA